ncbi:MAG: biotin--[acetyl-CoA-carboxylase] ligase [Clostridiales bacterium]|nr:biotin--[acetyl-CoA-carboxylase] ligase [Clostridiales bacterium]
MDELLRLLATGEADTTPALAARLHCTPEALAGRLLALAAEGYRPQPDAAGRLSLRPAADSLLPGDILAGLRTRTLGRGEILYATEMDSTNTQLKRAAAERNLPAGSLAVCDRQTAGRGRLQRAWETPEPGTALPCSVLLAPDLPPGQAHLVTLAVAVAAAAAIAETGLSPGIKWPNDVVVGGKKCVGILCEAVATEKGPLIVAGAGFNVRQRTFPETIRHRATSLWLMGAHGADRRALLCAYLSQLERAMAALEAEGLSGILAEYTARSVTLGRRVEVIGATETFLGTAEAIDDTGALWVLDDQNRRRQVWSGDVSVRGVMGYV